MKKDAKQISPLQKARKALGFTQETFSAALGVNKQTLHRYEAGLLSTPPAIASRVLLELVTCGGKKRETLEVIKEFAPAVGLDPWWLLTAIAGTATGGTPFNSKHLSTIRDWLKNFTDLDRPRPFDSSKLPPP